MDNASSTPLRVSRSLAVLVCVGRVKDAPKRSATFHLNTFPCPRATNDLTASQNCTLLQLVAWSPYLQLHRERVIFQSAAISNTAPCALKHDETRWYPDVEGGAPRTDPLMKTKKETAPLLLPTTEWSLATRRAARARVRNAGERDPNRNDHTRIWFLFFSHL